MRRLRVDGGLTNDPLLVSLQADAIGVPVEPVRRGRHRARGRRAGRGRRRALRLGCRSCRTCCSRTRRVEPERDDAWRSEEHQAWREFVEATAALDRR